MGENKRKSKKNNTTKSKTKTKTKTKQQYYGGELLNVGQQQKGFFGKLMSKKPSNDITADKYLTTFSEDDIFKHQSNNNNFEKTKNPIPCFPDISELKPKTTEKLSWEDFNVGYRFARCLTINDQGKYDYDSNAGCTMDETKYNRFIERYFCGIKDIRNKCKSINFKDINGGGGFDFDKFYLLYWFLYYVKESIILTEKPYEELREKIEWKYQMSTFQHTI